MCVCVCIHMYMQVITNTMMQASNSTNHIYSDPQKNRKGTVHFRTCTYQLCSALGLLHFRTKNTLGTNREIEFRHSHVFSRNGIMYVYNL